MCKRQFVYGILCLVSAQNLKRGGKLQDNSREYSNELWIGTMELKSRMVFSPMEISVQHHLKDMSSLSDGGAINYKSRYARGLIMAGIVGRS